MSGGHVERTVLQLALTHPRVGQLSSQRCALRFQHSSPLLSSNSSIRHGLDVVAHDNFTSASAEQRAQPGAHLSCSGRVVVMFHSTWWLRNSKLEQFFHTPNKLGGAGAHSACKLVPSSLMC